MTYDYLISYAWSGGVGRCFLDTKSKINSRKRVEEVEAAIMENNGLEDISIINFIELETSEEKNV